MTRKRVGQGLQDVFAQICPECNGRGIKEIIDPFQPAERSSRALPVIPKPTPPRHRPEPPESAEDSEHAEDPADTEHAEVTDDVAAKAHEAEPGDEAGSGILTSTDALG
jgi:Ribonuclease G/E